VTTKVARLQVLMNGSPVGWLSRRANGIISFRYDAAWLASGNTRPLSLSLSLPLITRAYSGNRVENFQHFSSSRRPLSSDPALRRDFHLSDGGIPPDCLAQGEDGHGGIGEKPPLPVGHDYSETLAG